jgi:hypothetical protein
MDEGDAKAGVRAQAVVGAKILDDLGVGLERISSSKQTPWLYRAAGASLASGFASMKLW